MKKFFLLLLINFFIIQGQVLAVGIELKNTVGNKSKPTISAIKEELYPTISAIKEQKREQMRERLNQATNQAERNEVRNEIQKQNKRLSEEIKNQLEKKFQNIRFSARIEGKITNILNNSVSVEDNSGKVYKVNITEKTQLKRRFWGKANLSEFTVGNQVKVIGRYVNEEKTEIDAVLIRNLSIEKRWGVFFGKVTTKSDDSFVMETIERGIQTVYFNSNTRFINRKGEKIVYKDVEIGHRVRIKGVWDKTLNKIIDTEEVKNFSLPALPVKEVSPSPIITQ